MSPWLRFLARRLLRLVLSLWILVTFSFLLVHLVPGDPVRVAVGAGAAPEVVAAIRAELGLDDHLAVQYVHYLGHLLAGDLGESLVSQLPVHKVVFDRLPGVLVLAALAFGLVILFAIPVGLGMAILNQNGRHRGAELSFTSTSAVIDAIPSFLVAVILVYVFGVTFGVLPIAGKAGPSSYVLPVLALAIGPAVAMARIVRVEALAVLDQNYIRTARAKRLRPRLVYLRHALPNAMTATLTLSGLLLSGLVAGTVLVEYVFAWPGLGPVLVDSIVTRDYPLIQAMVLVYGALVLVVNLLVDVALSVVDPRTRIREG